jgi:hypothetical protein
MKPRALVYRGSIEAVGLLIDPMRPDAKQRVMALYAAGVSVSEAPAGWVVRFPARRLRAETAPGTPLVEIRGALWAFPPSEAEREALSPPSGSIVRVQRGLAQVDVPPFRGVDPAAWLDLEGWSAVQVTSLGAPPPPAPPPEIPDVRAALDVAKADAQMAAVAAALAGIGRGGAEGAPGTPGPLVKGLAAAIRAAMAATSWLRGWWTRPAPQAEAAAGNTAATPPPAQPQGPGWFSRFEQWLASWLARTGLLALLERQHAAYLQKMMDLFEGGDLLEALRYAIPLSNGPGGGGIAWLPPSPRDALTFGGGGGGGGGLGLSLDLFAHIRNLYENAWKRLVAMGRVEEAAFVLAELLGREEEAVQLLETHGLLRKAAEVAEARGLAPGLVVRQWWIAGEHERAVQTARRAGAFADAVLRLEKTSPEEARRLRIAWAEALGDAGDYAQAVDVIWPVEEARPKAIGWMDAAADAGGTLGAAMLVRKLSIVKEAFPDVRDRLLPVLADPDGAALAVRHAVYEALLAVPETPEMRALARPAARSALRDLPELGDRAFVNRLVQITGDALLRSDAGALATTSARVIPLADREIPTTIVFTADEAGPVAAKDAVLLSDGRLLVALGEAGVRLVSRDGRTIVHWDQPADALITNPEVTRAIALARRGDWVRLARIDLAARKATFWADAEITTWSRSYDGSIWYVAGKDDVLGIDALAAKWKALWRVGDLKDVRGISWSSNQLAFLASGQRWAYELPGPRLRTREDVPASASTVGAGVGYVADWDGGNAILRGPSGQADLPSLPDEIVPRDDKRWVALRMEEGHELGGRVLLFRESPLKQRADLVFEGANPTFVRFGPDALVIGTDKGHLVVFDLVRGVALRRLRLG